MMNAKVVHGRLAVVGERLQSGELALRAFSVVSVGVNWISRCIVPVHSSIL